MLGKLNQSGQPAGYGGEKARVRRSAIDLHLGAPLLGDTLGCGPRPVRRAESGPREWAWPVGVRGPARLPQGGGALVCVRARRNAPSQWTCFLWPIQKARPRPAHTFYVTFPTLRAARPINNMN